MHEFSICQGIVEAVLDEFAKLDPRPVCVKKVRVVAGRLHQLVPDYLEAAYEVLVKDTEAEGSTLELKFLPVRARCAACTWEGEIQPPVFQCPECEGFDLEVTNGRELYLEQMEVEQP